MHVCTRSNLSSDHCTSYLRTLPLHLNTWVDAIWTWWNTNLFLAIQNHYTIFLNFLSPQLECVFPFPFRFLIDSSTRVLHELKHHHGELHGRFYLRLRPFACITAFSKKTPKKTSLPVFSSGSLNTDISIWNSISTLIKYVLLQGAFVTLWGNQITARDEPMLRSKAMQRQRNQVLK